jgi:MFS family permease
VLVGFAGGGFFPPFIAVVSNWFDRHRALAVSLTTAGVGVAPMTMSPFAGWLLTAQDWRAAQMTIAIIAALVLVPASLLVRQPPALAAGAALPATGATGAGGLSLGAALRSVPFVVLALTFFACCAMHSGPIFHTISYAVFCGVPALAAVSIYSLEGLAGLFGRVLLGALGDRYGAKRVLVAGLLLQALAAGAFVFARRLEELYAVSFFFGLAYGGVMPLYAVLARGYFGPAIMGGVIGAASLISSLGMALGPLAGVADFDDARSDHDTRSFPADREMWEAFVATVRWRGKALDELRLLPITLGFGRPRAERGRPLVAEPELASKILRDVAERSRPFGTQMTIDQGVGHVVLPAAGSR